MTTNACRLRRSRCWWCGEDPLYVDYHDREWGQPVHDDRKIFEMMLLESFQAGLSWITILRKRENFRKAFAGFDPRKIARFTRRDISRLMKDAGIVRNRAKIESAINNARQFLAVQREFASFDRYIWSFTKGKTIRVSPRPTPTSIRATSPESDALSRDLKARGFRFMGSTVCYAHMQATGMVDDHVAGCFRAKRTPKRRSAR